MDDERQLLLAALAREAGLIDEPQLNEVLAHCFGLPRATVLDHLEARGWLTPSGRDGLEARLGEVLRAHGGDARAALRDQRLPDDLAASPATLGVGETTDHATPSGFDSTAAHPATPSNLAVQPPRSGPDASLETRHRYTLTSLHASGGIGQVWLARDDVIGRVVALKELRPERSGDPISARRFVQEARITGRLEHPGIVPVYELASPDDGRPPFYTMRFVRGRTLAEASREHHAQRGRRAREDPLRRLALLNAFVTVCHTIAFAHDRGVIHRDLKGSNIVLGDYGEVVVLDWGLAKAFKEAGADGFLDDADLPDPIPAGRDATLEGQVLGTPAYISPEQAEGRPDLVGRRSDVYGLGAVLYEILTGQPPFVGKDTEEILRRVREQTPEPPRRLNREAPRALEAIALKAIARKPDDRYDSATALARDVQRWVADQPVLAYREPLGERLRRSARRHRTLAAAGTAVALTTLVALTVGWSVLQRERDLSDQRQKTLVNYEMAIQALEEMAATVQPTAFAAVPSNALPPTADLQSLSPELHQPSSLPQSSVPGPQPRADLASTPRFLFNRVRSLLERLGDVAAPDGAAPPAPAEPLPPSAFPPSEMARFAPTIPPPPTAHAVPSPREVRRRFEQKFRQVNSSTFQVLGD